MKQDMSGDRELLELAAKAPGVAQLIDDLWERRRATWNPLTDDGDALRLAVKLGLGIIQWTDDASAIHAKTGMEWSEPYGSDPCAATRRAIVRAAAEIGRQMQEGGAE